MMTRILATAVALAALPFIVLALVSGRWPRVQNAALFVGSDIWSRSILFLTREQRIEQAAKMLAAANASRLKGSHGTAVALENLAGIVERCAHRPAA